MSRGEAESADVASDLSTTFQIWGSRGSRNGVCSKIGTHTSCYSLAVGEDLYIFDAGSGLLELSSVQAKDPRLSRIRRVHLLVSHAHWDHWEGLKDAEWLWRKGNGIEFTIFAPKEALESIAKTFEPPSFVKLEILALGTVKSLSFVELQDGKEVELPSATLRTLPLNHYSGIAPNTRTVCTLGYRLAVDNGPTVVYLCDHEPAAETVEMEDGALTDADLAIVDASYGDISEHAFGHGSIEATAVLSRRFPKMRVLAAHHGALREDHVLEEAMQRHGADLPQFTLAVEGTTEHWDAEQKRFVAAQK